MRNTFIIVTFFALLGVILMGCSQASGGNPDNSTEENNTEENTPADTPQRNPSVNITFDDDCAFSGKDLSLTIAFTDYDSNPTAVDVFIENTGTAYASNVSVNSNKVTITVPSSFSSSTISFYVKAGEIESNHISLKYGYLVTVDQCLDFLNSITSSDAVLVRVTGNYDDFSTNVCTTTSPLKTENIKIRLDLSKMNINTADLRGCLSLVSIRFPENIQSFCLENCTNLIDINIPESVTNFSGYCFKGCEKLETRIVIPRTQTTISSWLFYNCRNLKEVILHDDITIIGSDAFRDCKSLETIHLPNQIGMIEARTFSGCQKLNEIEIPNGVQKIQNLAFANCYHLNKVTIPESMTFIKGNAFMSCNLANVIFTNKTGWKAGDTDISTSDLANPATAATLLKTNDTSVDWTRTAN